MLNYIYSYSNATNDHILKALKTITTKKLINTFDTSKIPESIS